ncbi:hypothetical protein VTN02DRAFT_3077 [Thermoascus thermophilus]
MEPILSAVSSNADQLYTLLRCIGFAPKASVQITPDGIRFSVEEGRVMQGLAFLDKTLFSTYTFNAPPTESSNAHDESDEEGVTYPRFLISLSALLETLQIFGINDTSATNSSAAPQPNPSSSNAFTTPALLLNRSCTIQYPHLGAPLSITLSEAGIKTTCELTTYEPDDPSFGSYAGELDIPLQRDAIILKIIMRSTWLHNAITELDATNPTVLTLSASAKREPFFALSGSGGPFSESTVEFSIEKESENGSGASALSHTNQHKVISSEGGGSSRSRAAKKAKLAPTVTETFLVSPPSSMGSRVKQNYRFALIRKASRAMAAANKVSIRGDRQGVLSLQFMIELGDNNAGLGGNISFVDFRFVPLVDEEEARDDDDDQGERGNEEE